MKKVFSMSFLLFATTLCFSAQAGKADKVSTKNLDFSVMITSTPSELPMPVPGCSLVPPECPKNPKPPMQ